MKSRVSMFLYIVLLLIVYVPVAVAGSGTTLSLDKTTASPGDTVTASGTTSPGSWVPIKVIDGEGNILVFDTGKADAEGYYRVSFTVPNNASGALTIVVGEGYNVATGTLNGPQDPDDEPGKGEEKPQPGNSHSGGGPPAVTQPVYSTTGSATVSSSAGGAISLGDEASLKIPENALTGTDKVEVTITKVTPAPAVPQGFRLLGSVYEFRVGGMASYSFDKKVTLTFSFDANMLKPGETPAIYYYDQTKQGWVHLGGTVSGNTITVEVDHFTHFAVLVREKAPDATLIDLSGHWAEQNIRELIALGAISGYPDGTFKPDNNITRAEFVSILVKTFKLEPHSGKVFADTTGHWAQDSIATAVHYGIVGGYNEETFGANDNITREQMAVMIVNATKLTSVSAELAFADSSRISSWSKDAMVAAVNKGIINGYPDNTVRPQSNATRAEAVTVIVNAL